MLIEREVSTDTTSNWPSSPYKGLNYYTAADAPLFAQREDSIAICASIVGRYTTKLLLIHGRSGTGKSSFLRAGLLPQLLRDPDQFTCLRAISDVKEPYLIRCTDDPIARLRSALLVAVKADASLSHLPDAVKSSAQELLQETSNSKLSQSLLSALEAIAEHTRGTLVLVIDQSEEVLTLSSDSESRSKKEAFFKFLEHLCFRPIDVKVIISLRTEYYGQFCDWFRVLPSSTVSTKKAGLEQFMLHGLESRADLIAAIERPTLKTPMLKQTSPFEAYGFDYEPALVGIIADEIVRHCGESSALPVMQVVCSDLYSSVVRERGRTTIKLDDYRRQGGVEGALDRFIEQSIKAAVSDKNRGPSERDIDSWRDVLSILVGRQEGGALTTLLAPAEEVAETARKKGLVDVERSLTSMADERYRLLRKVGLVNADHSTANYFSLGHDSIAASLFRWKESRDRLADVSFRLRRMKIIGGVLFLLALLVISVVYAQSLVIRRTALLAMSAYADSEPQLDARLRLLLLVSGLNTIRGPEALFLPAEELESTLRKTIRAAPIAMYNADAFGLSSDGRRLAILRGDSISVGEPLDAKSQRDLGVVGSTERPRPNIQFGPWVSVGFLSGLDAPVAYKNGQFTFWNDGQRRVVELSEVVSLDAFNRVPFIDIAGGSIRVTAFNQAGKLSFHDLGWDKETATLKPLAESSIQLASPLWPTYSDFSSLLTTVRVDSATSGAASLLLNSRTNFSLNRVVQLSPGRDASQPIPEDARRMGVRSLTFANQDEAIVVRNDAGRFVSYSLQGRANIGPKTEFAIPEELAALSALQPGMFTPRPLLAANHSEGVWRFAWLTTKGIAQARSDLGSNNLFPNEAPLLPTISSLETANKLLYSKDGSTLVLVQQKGPGQGSARVWDVSQAKIVNTSLMSRSHLSAEACRIAALADGGERLTADERRIWTSLGSEQPCGASR